MPSDRKALRESKSIISLSLADCWIRGRDVKTILDALGQNKTLNTLDISSNKIDSLGAKIISRILIHHNETLLRLNLGTNQIGTPGAIAIAEALRHNKSLLHLNIEANRIDMEGTIAIGESLQVNSTLRELVMGGNIVRVEGARAIASALHCNTTLYEINLSGCTLEDEGGALILEALEHNCCLKKLDLSEIFFGALCVGATREILEQNKTLRELILLNDDIDDSDVVHLMDGLKQNTTLQVFDLGDNHVGDVGAAAIGEVLQCTGPSLQELSLNFNEIESPGASAIAHGLRTNRSLRMLDLYRNNIGDPGAKALSESLSVNSSLEELKLVADDITDEGVGFIAETLKLSNCTLSKLRIGGHGVTQAGFLCLFNSLRLNTSLRELLLIDVEEDVCFEFEEIEGACLEALESNTTLQDLKFSLQDPWMEANAILERNWTIAQEKPAIMQEENLTLGLWPFIIAKWPAHVMFGIFRDKQGTGASGSYRNRASRDQRYRC